MSGGTRAWRRLYWQVHPSRNSGGFWRKPWLVSRGLKRPRPPMSNAYSDYLNITLRFPFQRELGQRAWEWRNDHAN